MILDIRARPDDARLYEVLDAATGEPIDEPIWYANDDRGFYSRYSRHPDGSYVQDPDGEVLWEDVVRPIRIVPRLERLCASLRADLHSSGIPADDIPEPVLGALALFNERLEAIERFVVTRRESIPSYAPRSEEEIRRITGASSPPVNSAEWLESVTRTPKPMTQADLERSFPSLRVESVARAEEPEEYGAGPQR